MKRLINASNLHAGGGVQVASSAIGELTAMENLPSEMAIWTSTAVDDNFQKLSSDLAALPGYESVNTHGMNLLGSHLGRRMQTFAAVFTIFGPLYVWRLSGVNITGFAQPWIIYPDNECYAFLPFVHRLKTRLKYWVQGLFFKRADVLVVELEHVKQGLIRVLGIPENRIHVVHNCISSIYLDESMWQPVDVPTSVECLRLGFLGRNYLHKNTSIFPAIVAELEQRYSLMARIYVTFTEQEWAECTPIFRAVCINVGPLAVSQCPRFYEVLDAVVFPSLLECFSATPLEAMAMEKPLFASDRPFNRDICGAHAHYFDPLDPVSAAAAIARVFAGPGPNASALRVAREHAINFSSPKERAEKYLALLMASVPTKVARP
jgi:glycosyltransferase involved in cell wall biosynthesis